MDIGAYFDSHVYYHMHFACDRSMVMIAEVAQLIEQLICNHQGGSLSLPSGTNLALSSNGLGCHSFKVKMWVRFPLGLPKEYI